MLFSFVRFVFLLSLRSEFISAFPRAPRTLAQSGIASSGQQSFLSAPLVSDFAQLKSRASLNMSSDEPLNESDEPAPLNKAVLLVGSTTSMLVAFTFFAVLAYQRDALMVSFFIGAISNGILSKILKKLLNQERPSTVDINLVKEKPSDKGMPSSHAMSLGFIGTFTGLALPYLQLPLLMYVAISLYYRVHTQLHTREQVAVGLIVGVLNGAMWWTLCNGSNPLLPSVNVMDWVSNTILNDQGLLPVRLLVVPAAVGLIVVGSFERRISKWLKKE